MLKASLTLPNGTVVTIEGPPDEVQRLLALYSTGAGVAASPPRTVPAAVASPPGESKANGSAVDLVEIVNIVRTSESSESIEEAVLNRISVVNRVLLPLYIVHEHMANAFGLTSGEISKITSELGVPITQPNVSTCLSGPAKAYVMGDKMRVKGHAVRYRLNRRGLQYFADLLKGG